MQNKLTSEVPFFMCSPGQHLFAVRSGIPVEDALSQAAALLEMGHELMLFADELDSHSARSAATWIVEMASAALSASTAKS